MNIKKFFIIALVLAGLALSKDILQAFVELIFDSGI